LSSIVVLQSNYIPWGGYFKLISLADYCVFYDDVQYTKNDWRNRNTIQLGGDQKWLTIPVGDSISRKINEVKLPIGTWRNDHLRLINQAYNSEPAFNKLGQLLHEIYLNFDYDNLSDYNQAIIKLICKNHLDIETEFLRSEEFCLEGTKNVRLQNLLLQCDASEYITGPAGLNYLDGKWFKQNGIRLSVIDYAGYVGSYQEETQKILRNTIIGLLAKQGSLASKHFKGKVEKIDAKN
jgi:hypothetical protein